MGTIEEYHGECLTAISSEQGKEATARLDRLMVETNQIAQQETKKPHFFSLSLNVAPPLLPYVQSLMCRMGSMG